MKFKITYLKIPLLICCLSFFVMFFISEKSIGQENCAFKLEEAQNQYDIGVLDSIPVMLNPCINKGFSGDELARAYKLLILTYLFQDNQDAAKTAMKRFLKKFPEYEIKANDPVEFAYLYKSFKTIPVYSIGVLVGGNYSYIRLIEPHGVYNTADYNGEYSVLGIGFQGGLQIKRYINEKIELNLDALYKSSKFEFKNNPTSYSTTIFEESQTGIDIPLTATYDFAYSFKGFNPYLRAGFSFGYLLSSTGKLKLNNEIFTGLEDLSSPEFDITSSRNTYNFSGVVGAGIKYKIKNGGYIIGDFRYYLGILNVVNTNDRYANLDNNLSYMYVDNDFAINNFTFSLGYVWSFYKTSEKRK